MARSHADMGAFTRVKCPFYKESFEKMIVCEGWSGDTMDVVLRFRTETGRERWSVRWCEHAGIDKGRMVCPYYEMVMGKHRDGG